MTTRLFSTAPLFSQSGLGAVPRTIQDKLRETVSVKDFGARGDGEADDTEAIQRAADAAIEENACLRFPPGRFRCGALIFSEGDSLRWVGERESVLVAVAAEQTFATVNGDVFISGLSFEDYMVGFNCDDVPAGAKLRFDGLTFTDCGLMGTAGGRVNHQAAIQCRDVDAAVIDSLFVTNCILEGGDFGICWRGGFDQATIAFNRFEGQTRMGVMLGDNTADQKTRKAAKVLYNRFKDIIGTSATENEIHAALVYAYDALVQGNSVDTVYDIHSATHDSEAIYL